MAPVLGDFATRVRFMVRGVPRNSHTLVFEFELAFFGDTLERFAGIFDPVLIIVAVGGQQLDDFVRAAGAGPADRAQV